MISQENIEISVVIPAYNAADFICDALNSVFAQTTAVKEVIVIDDCSTDNTLEVLENYNEHIVILKNQENSGASHSRNSGLKAAKGTHVAFLDADDVWVPKKLEIQIALLAKSGAEFIYSDTDLIGITENYVPNALDLKNNDVNYQIKETLNVFDNPYFSTSTILISLNLVKNIGYFREDLKTAEDVDYCLRASLHTNFVAVDQKLAITRRVEGSLGSCLNSYQDNLNVVDQFVSENKVLFANQTERVKRVKKKILQDWLADLMFLRQITKAKQVARQLNPYLSFQEHLKLNCKLSILAILKIFRK